MEGEGKEEEGVSAGFRKCGKTVRSPTGREMEERGSMEGLIREMMSELRGGERGVEEGE